MTKQKRKTPTERRTRCRKPATLDKGRRAFELRAMGWSFPEVADELDMAVSSAHELYTAFVLATPNMDTEGHRKRLLATLDMGMRAMGEDIQKSKDRRERAASARALTGLVKTAAQVAGVVKLAPVIVMPPPKRDDRLNLADLPIAQVRRMREIRAELLQIQATNEAPALEAHGEESHDDERSDGGGYEPGSTVRTVDGGT